MTNKFNPKVYQGKARVFRAVPNARRISRIWIWNPETSEYEVPTRGNLFYAAKYDEKVDGSRQRIFESFSSLEEARAWQGLNPNAHALVSIQEQKSDLNSGPSFREILTEWKRRRFPQIAYSTQVQYDKILRLHFNSLMEIPITMITPKRIDDWIDHLKEGVRFSKKRLTRITFGHELSLLSTVLRYYQDYYDDNTFHYPVKQRHTEAIRLCQSITRINVPKDLSEAEFLKFREELSKCRNGKLLAVLATVQYFQALRISEAAGLYWEDIHFDHTAPWHSRIKIVRSVCYPHRGKEEAFIKGGFKNAVANNGIKEQPMFPEVYEELKTLYSEGATGMVFGLEDKPIAYRIIQCHFDRSFKRAGLPYRGTHVMRHGGCRRVFNDDGELSIAQQLLGNADLRTTLVYAKRQASALTKVVHGYWERKGPLITIDHKSQLDDQQSKSLIAFDHKSETGKVK